MLEHQPKKWVILKNKYPDLKRSNPVYSSINQFSLFDWKPLSQKVVKHTQMHTYMLEEVSVHE